jgi:ribonuclease HI
MTNTQADNAAARIKSISSRRKTVALGIRRRATEAVNEYRAHRLVSLRSDLEIRLIRKAEDDRLRVQQLESSQARKLQQQKETEALQQHQARRLQQKEEKEALRQQHQARRLQQKKEKEALRQQHQARRLQQKKEKEALRQQHRLVVARLKEILSSLKETKPRYKPAFDTDASFPLQERHQVQPPPVPGPPTTQIGPLCLSPVEAASMRVVQDTHVDNSTPRVLYSDGSLLNSGTLEVSQAFGVVDLTQDNPLTVQGRTDGHASSAKAELMGLLAAVLSAPPEQDIVVKLDNQSVVEQYSRLVKNRRDTLPRKRFRSTYAGIWAVLWQAVESRPGGVEVVWIKGHSNIHGNELADQAAKVAAQSGSVPWMVDLTQQTDITTFAHCYGGIVEIDLRQLLKQQSTIRHHQAWTSQRRVKRAIPDIDDVEWNSTLAYVHDRHAVFTFYSNSKDSHQRTHHIKKLHGMLPTLNSMQARKPNLYPTCVCRRCELEKEDNDHVWKCPSAAETTTEIWKEAMGKINEWGVQATNSYNAARKREYKRAVDRGRQVPRPVPIHWWPPSDADHVRGFSSIGGARAVHSGSPAPDRDEKPMWNVSDLLRGITPLSMLTEWSAVFRTPMSIAKTVLHKFVGYLEAQASELIWKPRCSATIAWEQSQGISAKDKTSKYTGPRGDWSQGYGYITHDGFCPCGASLATHCEGRCPGATKDPRAADERLLESLLGRRRLSMMERMGRIPFIRI